METIKIKKDYGWNSTYKKWNGNFLTDESYDEVISTTKDTTIYKPGASLFENTPLAYVVCDAYPDDQVFECLKTIEDTTKMRANASGPILEEDMKAKGITEYRLRTPNSYQVKTKKKMFLML